MPKLLRAQVPPDGHRLKDPLEYSCGPDQVWVYGALRPKDGQVLTLTASSRDTAGYLRLLQAIDQAPRSALRGRYLTKGKGRRG